MFKIVAFALVALAAVSAVNGAVLLRRKTPPAGWNGAVLESYDDYNTRYLAIGCQGKHNTQFFDDCCYPMKKGETLENNRKAYCSPGANPSSSQPPANLVVMSTPTLSPTPSPTPVPGDDCESDGSPSPTSVPEDDCEDDGDDDDNTDDGDDDCDDEPVSSPPVYASSPSPTPAPTPTPSPAAPSPTEEPPTEVSSSPEPSPSPVDNTPSSETHTGGHVTWFTQNGNAGACGDVHSDDDFIAALDYRVYGDLGAKSKYCGQKIRVSWQGKSVDVTVADACPSCDNSASVDLSKGAFAALASFDVGLLTDTTWELLG